MTTVLTTTHAQAGYGPHRVLHDVTFLVDSGQFVALVGSNGAGKTTLLKTICGALPLRGGDITVLGKSVRNVKTFEWVSHGLVHVPEDRHLFGQMTVVENLKLGAFHHAARHHIDQNLERVYSLFPVLADRSSQRASSLSGGEQQMLSIGRGVMGMPKMIMLDEPSLGLSPKSTGVVFDAVAEINRQGVTVLLV
jgi:branched-chain amino acid transport system ATP-binding protein